MKRLLTTLICLVVMLGTISAQETTTFKERRAEREKNRALKLLEDGKYDRAVTLLRKSAEGGCAIAQYNLGVCYYQGVGVTVDIDEAIRWWRMAAEYGCVEAQNNL